MRAFIVRPFGTRDGIAFDRVESELIAPVLDELGISGRTTQEIARAGNIRTDMFRGLLVADLVIADISIHNANVYYELGIRHALRDRITVLIRARVDEVPFDLRTDRYLEYDPDAPEAARDLLRTAIEQSAAEPARRQSRVPAAAQLAAGGSRGVPAGSRGIHRRGPRREPAGRPADARGACRRGRGGRLGARGPAAGRCGAVRPPGLAGRPRDVGSDPPPAPRRTRCGPEARHDPAAPRQRGGFLRRDQAGTRTLRGGTRPSRRGVGAARLQRQDALAARLARRAGGAPRGRRAALTAPRRGTRRVRQGVSLRSEPLVLRRQRARAAHRRRCTSPNASRRSGANASRTTTRRLARLQRAEPRA